VRFRLFLLTILLLQVAEEAVFLMLAVLVVFVHPQEYLAVEHRLNLLYQCI
jgi:hypothetical protein